MKKTDAEKIKAKNEIRRQIRKNSVADFPFIFMNVAATIVASYGLLADSTAVVIGATLIAMLLGTITGISLALIDGNKKLLGIALLSEFAGVLCVLAAAFIIGLIHNDIPAGKEITSRTAPNIMDLIIALAGGEYEAAGGGFLLFFANFVAIQFSSSVVLWLAGYHRITKKTDEENNQIILQNAVSVGLLVVLAIALGYNFLQSAQKQNFERAVRNDLGNSVKNFQATSIDNVQFKTESGKIVVTAVLRTPFVFSKDQVETIEKNAAEAQRL